jgi:hypothetical protein
METLEMIKQVFREENMSHRKSKLTKTVKGETGDELSQEHIIIFFDISGVVHKEFILTGQTVNSSYYCDILWQMH